MMIYLNDQREFFPDHLERSKKVQKIHYDKSILKEKFTCVGIEAKLPFENLNTDFLFSYRVFPDNIMTYLTEWEFGNREMNIGDTIVQQAYIPPFQKISQKVIFGVRINEIIRQRDRVGFSYETLEGHVEMGMSTFTLEKDPCDKIIFKIQTFSRPGNLLTKIAGPFFSVPYQTYCTKKALINVKRQLEAV
jgi:hypothetical protein